MVNYDQSVQEEDEDTAPTGYLTNNTHSHHFYPIYLSNPLFSHRREQPCMVLAKYIKYSTNHKYAYRMIKKGEVCNVPVQVGRRVHHYTCMMEANWRDLT